MRRVLTTLSLTAALVGCGGDDALSPEEYRSELRDICRESDRRTKEVERPTRATPESITDYLDRLRDINSSTIERVERLEPPEDLRAAHERALTANRDGRAKLDAIIEELEGGGDPVAVLTDAQRDLREASEAVKDVSRDVGVPECAN